MNQCILVVEDDAKISSIIKLYLEREGYQVSIAGNGRDGLKQARALQPSLVILDLMLPQLSGMEVCRLLRSESGVYVIMLTARTAEEDKLRGLDLGADDYMTKPFSPRELMARVRAVLRRGRPDKTPLSDKINIKGLSVDFQQHKVWLNETPIHLTRAEFTLLETFVKAPERVFTRQQLVEKAFGYDYEALDRTIDAHIMNLRRKIEPDRLQPSFIVTVYGVGYRFSSEDHDS